MYVSVLGSVGVTGVPGAVPSGQIARRVLAVLVAEANRPVHSTRLADLVWPGEERSRENSLQAHVSRWRKVLGAHRITYGPAGYSLLLGPDELDALRFERLVSAAAAARASGDLGSSIASSRQALALWHGRAFADLADDDCVRGRRTELETARDATRHELLEMLCETGAYEEVVPEAIAVVAAEPWNEPIHRVLARAHYGRGDQVGALEVLSTLEARLRHDLGLDLGPPSQALRAQILRHEPALDPLPRPVAGAMSVPETGLADRVARLPETTQQILRAAALSGIAVDTAQLAHVLALDGPSFADALAPALSAGIVVRTDGGARFADHGVHERVTALVPAGEALTLHQRLGEGLLDRGHEPELVRRAADHLAAAASVAPRTALRAVALDRELTQRARTQARYRDAVRHARRALASAAYLTGDDAARVDRAELSLALAEALQRAGDLDAAMTAYASAARVPDATVEVTVRCALAFEECSVHARRHRAGAHDPSIELLERALEVAEPAHPQRVELLASLAQALMFSGLGGRAEALTHTAVAGARAVHDRELLARTLLRGVAAHDPATGAEARYEMAREAVAAARSAGADELELDALAAWVPELMRVGRLVQAERVIRRIEQLADQQENVLHRCKVAMWRAAVALAAERHDEAEVLIEDFWEAGRRDGYDDTPRVHGFQSILLALGRRDPERAADVLSHFDDDEAFEPWRAAHIAVAHAREDRAALQRLLVPWSARRFTMSRPFLGIKTFCACLIAPAVAERGDPAARERLAELIGPGVGQNQVLGAGAAMLGDAAGALGLLAAADGDHDRAGELLAQAVRNRAAWRLDGPVQVSGTRPSHIPREGGGGDGPGCDGDRARGVPAVR